MKKNSLFSGFLGSLRSGATALIAATVITVGMSGAIAQTVPAPLPAVTTNTAPAPVAAKFDGVAIYNAAFEALRAIGGKGAQDTLASLATSGAAPVARRQAAAALAAAVPRVRLGSLVLGISADPIRSQCV